MQWRRSLRIRKVNQLEKARITGRRLTSQVPACHRCWASLPKGGIPGKQVVAVAARVDRVRVGCWQSSFVTRPWLVLLMGGTPVERMRLWSYKLLRCYPERAKQVGNKPKGVHDNVVHSGETARSLLKDVPGLSSETTTEKTVGYLWGGRRTQ